jgi:predicted SAM-dependent methyltransferase
LKLDIGCGKNPKEGFDGIDAIDFGQKYILDVAAKDKKGNFIKWPFEDNSVEEIHCSHFVEHLKPDERIHFVNEIYRILIPSTSIENGKVTIIVPHYGSERAYGDMTHQWPPVVGFWFNYLDKDWREGNAPHNHGYTCDFKIIRDVTWGFSLHPSIVPRNIDYQMHALTFWREAAQDMIATLIKR